MPRTLSILLLLLPIVVVCAQVSSVPLGATIKGFVMPQRNSEGKLEANITGETAKAVSINRTEITGLKIELYEKEKLATTITSPKSDLWNLENRLSTRDGVEVLRGDLRITAKMMEWELKEQRAVLRQQVRVVIDKFDFGATPKNPGES